MKRNKGFTLIEILVVLAIIGILVALLFPVFKRVRENAHQTNCTSNLHQIGLAVALYRNDEKEYPSSLAFLLPNDSQLYSSPTTTADNTNGTGYLKSAKNLMCPDDDKDDTLRSSYGDISVSRPATPTVLTDYTEPSDMSRFVWNYYGYDTFGTAYGSDTVAQAAGEANLNLLVNTSPTYDADPIASGDQHYDAYKNPIKYSMSNRFAPSGTIITHCIFHRTQTSNADNATVIAPKSRDVILRLDGAAKVLDVSEFDNNGNTNNNSWQKQTG